MALTHVSFFTVIRNSCEDGEINEINNKLKPEYPVGESVPFVVQEFIKRLNLEHLETILKQNTTASATLFRILDVCSCHNLTNVIDLTYKDNIIYKALSATYFKEAHINNENVQSVHITR